MAISCRGIFGSCLLLGGAVTIFVGVLSVVLEGTLFDPNITEFPSNMSEAEAIAKNEIKSAETGEVVTVESLWENQPVVIVFFRRFGCAFCRVAARELSAIKPELDSVNARLIGIGVEELGKEDFLKGKFFDGELYIDQDKKCYKDLKFKRFGLLGMIPAMVVKSSRDAMYEARAKNVGGDMKGDIYQVGGTLVISAGGKEVLLSHKQASLADHVDVNEVLRSLGLPPKEKATNGEANTAQCNVDGTACQ